MKPVPPGYRAIAEALLVVFILVMGGTLGYMSFEGWSFFDSLYISVITLTTVGYLEVHPFSTEGRLFTMGLLLPGVFSLFYAATAAIRSIVGGELATRSDHMALQIEETEVRSGGSLCGRALRDTGLRQELGLIVVAIKRSDGKMLFNPAPESTIAELDILITLGPKDQQDRLRAIAT